VTPKLLSEEPIYRWFVFPHSFSGAIVEFFINKWNLKKGSSILDPFVGAGTTMVAAARHGINGLGVDISPLAVLVSNVKVCDYDHELVTSWKRLRLLLTTVGPATPYSDSAFSRRAFSARSLSVLEQIRDVIHSIPVLAHRNFFLLALVQILAGLSRAKRSGGWLRWQHRGGDAATIIPRFEAQVELMLNDIGSSERPVPRGKCEARLADARGLVTRQKFDALITSPPYPNRHDYSRIFNVELAFAFLGDSAIKTLRHESFRSHVEAQTPQHDLREYVQIPELERAIAKIEKRAIDRRIPRMLRGYFQDLYLTLRSSRACLKPSAPLALIVGNVRYNGVTVPVDTGVARIALSLGYSFEQVMVARYRGNSAQQMGQYGRLPMRESVVLLRNTSESQCH